MCRNNREYPIGENIPKHSLCLDRLETKRFRRIVKFSDALYWRVWVFHLAIVWYDRSRFDDTHASVIFHFLKQDF